jgi:hypothetical protein
MRGGTLHDRVILVCLTPSIDFAEVLTGFFCLFFPLVIFEEDASIAADVDGADKKIPSDQTPTISPGRKGIDPLTGSDISSSRFEVLVEQCNPRRHVSPAFDFAGRGMRHGT